MTAISYIAFVGLGGWVGWLATLYGAGGGWAVAPILMWTGRSPVVAVGTSLAMVAATGLAGLWQHSRRGAIRWSAVGWSAVACAIGAEAGRRLLLWLEPTGRADVLVSGTLSVVLLLTGMRMISGWGAAASAPGVAGGLAARRWRDWIAFGVPVGLIGGMSGLGGGLMAVPWLTLRLRLDHREAVPISLGAVAATGLWGALRYGAAGRVDWGAAACLAAGSVLGTRVGVRACRGASRGQFLRAFGVLLATAAIALLLDLAGLRRAAHGLLGLILVAAGAMVWMDGPQAAIASRPTGSNVAERPSPPPTR